MESLKFSQSQFLSLSANQNPNSAPERHGEILLEGENNLVDVEIKGEYDCDICKMRFDDLTEYARHRKFHRNTTPAGRRKRPRLTDGAIMKDGKYGCQFCPKVFDTKVSYSNHLRRSVKHSAAVNMIGPVEVEAVTGITFYGMDPRTGVRDEGDSWVQNKAAFDKEDDDDEDELANLRLLSEVSARDKEDDDDELANLTILKHA